jgi:hypothetical protein
MDRQRLEREPTLSRIECQEILATLFHEEYVKRHPSWNRVTDLEMLLPLKKLPLVIEFFKRSPASEKSSKSFVAPLFLERFNVQVKSAVFNPGCFWSSFNVTFDLNWRKALTVGDSVSVGATGDTLHSAIILAVSPDEQQLFVHYQQRSHFADEPISRDSHRIHMDSEEHSSTDPRITAEDAVEFRKKWMWNDLAEKLKRSPRFCYITWEPIDQQIPLKVHLVERSTTGELLAHSFLFSDVKENDPKFPKNNHPDSYQFPILHRELLIGQSQKYGQFIKHFYDRVDALLAESFE